MKKAVFIPTIQHTGSWFCLELLANHSAGASGHLIHHEGLNRLLYEYNVSRLFDKKEWANSLFGPELTLIYAHFGEGEIRHTNDVGKFPPMNLIEDLVQMFPSISTIRDPLLVLLSRQARHPELKHFYLINGFVDLVRLYRKYRIFVLPVDLYAEKPNTERYRELEGLMGYVGLEIEPYLAFWAINWPIYNPTIALTKESKLKIIEYRNYYESKNIKGIIDVIPEEYEYLKSKEPILKLFLQELGYINLLWWD